MAKSAVPAGKATTQVGSVALRQSSGYVWEEFDPNLRFPKSIDVFSRMEADETCGAVVWAFETMLLGVQWEVDPAKPAGDDPEAEIDPKAQEGADFLKAVLFEDMQVPWHEIVADAASCLTYGFAVHEKIFEKRDDGRIGIRDLAPRPQHSIIGWKFSDDNETLIGVRQRIRQTGAEVVIPIEKCLLFRPRMRNRNPEGRSILRSAYKPWFMKEQIMKVEAIGLERDLNGVPEIRVPSRLLTDPSLKPQLETFVQLARDLRFNEQAGIVLPSDPWMGPDGSPSPTPQYSVTLLSSSSNRVASTDPTIRRHEANIARSVLADFMTLGQNAAGSFALSQDKTDLFLRSLESVLSMFCAVLNRDLVQPLWVLNGLPPETRPTLRTSPIAPEDIEKLANYVATLAGAGARMFPDKNLENDLRRRGSLPPMSAEAEEAGLAAMQQMEAGGFPEGDSADAPTADEEI